MNSRWRPRRQRGRRQFCSRATSQIFGRSFNAIVRDIITSNQRAADVIQRLRALLDRNEVCAQPLAPVELVDEVLELAHAELIARRVVATALFAPDISPVFGDRVQLQQVLLNLVLNACEAIAPRRRSIGGCP